MLIYRTLVNDAIPLHNFKFQKKIALSLTKDCFSQSFHSFMFFTKGWVVQKMEPKGNSIELSTFLKYDLTEVEKAPS